MVLLKRLFEFLLTCRLDTADEGLLTFDYLLAELVVCRQRLARN